jgi:peptidoglycan hydrolase-like protein with peptidoglycan-binding domain
MLVSAATVAALAVGSLAGASPGVAATHATAGSPAASVRTISPFAVNNLGLSTTQAKHWQCWLNGWGFSPGTIDGLLGTRSWMAAQKFLNWTRSYVNRPLIVDGVLGPETIKALQNWLGGIDVDGVVGPQTRAAFADFNNTNYC